MARRKITLHDTSRFHDPANLTWHRYVEMQTRERERYLAERAAIPDDVINYRAVKPGYLANAVEAFANNFWSEEAATRYIATVAARAPSEEIKKCCLF